MITVKVIRGLPHIDGRQCSYETKEIRSEIQAFAEVNAEFALPKKYTYVVTELNGFAKITKASIEKPTALTGRADFYLHDQPLLKERTRDRLTQIEALGMIEVGYAQFGIPDVCSGLYIEKVWSDSDEVFNDYLKWVKELIENKTVGRPQ